MTVKIIVLARELSHGVCKTIVETDRRFEGVSWLMVTDGPARAQSDAAGNGVPSEEYRADRLLARRNLAHLDGVAANVSA